MPSFNPFSSVSGRSSVTLYDIRYAFTDTGELSRPSVRSENLANNHHRRLENDFIVFRGTDHESSGQLLKGVIVLCLSAPLRMEDIRLRLTGTLRLK